MAERPEQREKRTRGLPADRPERRERRTRGSPTDRPEHRERRTRGSPTERPEHREKRTGGLLAAAPKHPWEPVSVRFCRFRPARPSAGLTAPRGEQFVSVGYQYDGATLGRGSGSPGRSRHDDLPTAFSARAARRAPSQVEPRGRSRRSAAGLAVRRALFRPARPLPHLPSALAATKTEQSVSVGIQFRSLLAARRWSEERDQPIRDGNPANPATKPPRRGTSNRNFPRSARQCPPVSPWRQA